MIALSDQDNDHLESSSRARAPRSFVRRAGRITTSQRRALDDLWARFGLALDEPLDAATTFGRTAPLCVEIGFGMGDSLAELARSRPEVDHIGIEVHEPGIGRLLKLADADELANLRVAKGDAVTLLERGFAPESLDAILIYFPDPWPKKRHHKRRLINPGFSELLCRRLRPGGRLHLASDWRDYAEQMLEVLDGMPDLENLAGPARFSPRPTERPQTKFERRGLRLGHEVFDLLYSKRVAGPT